MLSYSVGRFASLLENFTLNKVEQRKVARFANKYYRYEFCRKMKYHMDYVIEEYVAKFLRDSRLPYEVKREIARLAGIAPNKVNYEVVTEYSAAGQTPWPENLLAEVQRKERFNVLREEIGKLRKIE